MILGRPGSGKTTFASWLSKALNIPLHHLDKHYFIANWVERDREEFLNIQQDIVDSDSWIIDGNSIGSLEMRWSRADLVIYFNVPRSVCLIRLINRFLKPNKMIDDMAPGCHKNLRIPFIKYMWDFEERINPQINLFKKQYPKAEFKEIRNDKDLAKLKKEL